MALVLNKLIAVWYADLLFGANFMAGLEHDDGAYRLKLRVRFRRDNKIHNSKDERIWYQRDYPGATAETAIGLAREDIKESLEEIPGGPFKFTELVAGADGSEGLLKQLAAQPWAHLKTESLH